VEFLQPDSWQEALEFKASHPEARPVWGGTVVMVELNFDRERPKYLLDLTRVPELREWSWENGHLRVGAGVTHARVVAELGDKMPGSAIAARTIASPQIRNRGTVGGNLGYASPAGDALPSLYASEAEVEVASVDGVRRIPIDRFITGPHETALSPRELIAAVHVSQAQGPQQFCKVGMRNAMVHTVCSFALALDPTRGTVGTCVGGVGSTPVRAGEAGRFLEGFFAEHDLWDSKAPLDPSALYHFGELVRRCTRPSDDVRGSASYRWHAVGVIARRGLTWAWDQHRRKERCP
jgi:CO/xanthine dehydrogenase FAD-binding subunit